ncbi:S8 family peptidase [Jiangella rhizosphaerae]|uniref:Serine protease n=1 Tax=Jiangella rhizosphaerae TaxID=2293569 RepID=A0A418KGP0_9ACTN|nr:S8 family serine peptidase [Jiangella rhizosphaerae]RIQ11157.1 serine protease [Jiangella rhizosphaerae]
MRRRLLSSLSVLALVPGLWAASGPASSAETPAPAAAPPRGATGTTSVTLITGDVVTVTELAGGTRAVEVVPAPRPDGRAPSFLTVERDGDLQVIPDDVRSLVPARLDPALFNVTALIDQGYDDASFDTLPLIVSHGGGRLAALPSAEVTGRLESIGGTGVRLDKDDAPELGAALVTLAQSGDDDRRAAAIAQPPALAGVEKIWLDGRTEAALSESAGQVGAPAAWAAGLDGSGVTVAVLDTGIDAAHPDLAGTVVGERNFSWSETAADGVGHGTHVASIIAGTGAASGGRYRGVADGVDLLNGKVFDDGGGGFVSWAIEGMEWAAEQGADVVNMSLGADGTDGEPMSAAADALTAEHGTLFVVSTGNDGCAECVSHPAAAASALAVGAVTKSDVLADFSNRGPLPETYGIKPDVTAPGVGIVAARGSGTSMGYPVDDFYTNADGTSMAAPHVAGAAALLLQAEPALGPEELKGWLMTTARPGNSATVYEQGGGRIDIERALDGRVFGVPGSVSFGHLPWPHDDRPAVSRPVTYRNLTGADVVLDLSVDVATEHGTAPPAGTLTTSVPAVTVPAEGTATVELVLDTALGDPGLFGGYLTARAADGTTVRTPVGYHQEPHMVEVTVRGIGRDGRPAPGSATVLDVRDGSVNATRNLDGDPAAPCTDDPYAGSTCVRVPVGTYSVLGFVDTMPASVEPGAFATPLNRSLVGDPEIEITADTEVVLDARLATEVLVDTPEHETKRNVGAAMAIGYHRVTETGAAVDVGRSMWPGAMLEERLFMQPMDAVSTGEFAAHTRWRLEAPQIAVDVVGQQQVRLQPQYYPASAFSDFSRQFPMLDGDLEAEIVDAGLGRPEDVAAADLTGAVALVRRSDEIPVAEQANNAAAAGAVLVVVANDRPGPDADPGAPPALLEVPTVRVTAEEGDALLGLLAAGPVRVAARGVPDSPYSYELVYTEEGAIPADLRYVASTDQLARVDAPVHSQLADETTMTRTWYPYQAWDTSSFSQPVPVSGPRTLVTYLSAGPSLRWTHTGQAPESPYGGGFGPYEPTEHLLLFSDLRSYEPGERYVHSWFEQPLAPGASPFEPPTRTGDTVTVSMGLQDGAGNFGSATTSWFDAGFDTELRVYRDDELLLETPWQSSASFETAPEPARHRVEYAVGNGSVWAALSTRTRSVWTFTSQRPADGERRVEPLLAVDYDVDVDLRNRAPHPRERRGPHEIVMTFGHPAGAGDIPVEEVALEVSYDDGATWQEVRNVRQRGDDRYVATLYDRGSTGGYLSWRLSAADAQGNTLEQEIIRAYALSQR